MTHNFSILYRTPDSAKPLWFETKTPCLEDAMIELHKQDENAEYIKHEIDINPAAYESESDTIQAAIINRPIFHRLHRLQ